METNHTTPAADVKGPGTGRLGLGLNIIVQIGLAIAGLVMLNFLAYKYYARWDWTQGKNITLSPQTKALLASLEKPVQVIVMFASRGETEDDAQQLLREYQFASKGKLTVEIVHPYANPARANELQTQFRFGETENVVIFTYDGRHKFVYNMDLVEMENAMDAAMSQREPRMLGFKGEQAFTSTLLELTEIRQNKLYFIGAHGEYDGDAKELLGLREYLTRQNLKLETLKLADKDRIPEDASVIAILGPRFDFSERDLKLLTEYWERKGRIFIGTGWTNSKKPNLNAWLGARGVRPQNDIVLRVDRLGNVAQINPFAPALVNHKGSPITKDLVGIETTMYGMSQSLQLDRNLERSANLRLTELLSVLEGFWGETEYDPNDRTSAPLFDPKKDHAPPLLLGVAVERGGSDDPMVKLETSRMVVFGNGDFLSDRGLQAGPASLNLALNSVNWLVSRENLISIPPKVKERQNLQLSEAQVGTIRWWVMLLIPLSIALFGLYHLVWRAGRNVFTLTLWLAAVFLAAVGVWLALRWWLGLWKPTFKMSATFWITIGVAVAIGVAAAVANSVEQKRRVKTQD